MNRVRFSLAGLLIAVVLVCLAFAALRSNSRLVASIALIVYLGFICFGLVGVFACRRDARVFWVAFTVFGSIYWYYSLHAVALQGDAQGSYWSGRYANIIYGMGSWPDPNGVDSISPMLLTTMLLESIRPADETLSTTVGSKVRAEWQGGFYPATIIQVVDDQYVVAWDDGSPPNQVLIHQLRSFNFSPGLSANQFVAGHAVLGLLIALLGGGISWLLLCHRKANDRAE